MKTSKEYESYLIDVAVAIHRGLRDNEYKTGAVVYIPSKDSIQVKCKDLLHEKSYTIMITEDKQSDTDTEIKKP